VRDSEIGEGEGVIGIGRKRGNGRERED